MVGAGGAFGVSVLGACRAVLALDDYSRAVDQLCACDELLPTFEPKGCVQTLDERLRSATPALREQWLSTFVENDCMEAAATPSLASRCRNVHAGRRVVRGASQLLWAGR